jgi:multiple sugar transport system permease protein
VTASVIATVPMILVFFLAQKQIIQGVASSGLR